MYDRKSGTEDDSEVKPLSKEDQHTNIQLGYELSVKPAAADVPDDPSYPNAE